MDEKSAFASLADYLAKVPAIVLPVAYGMEAAGGWWVKFGIDIDHPLAWQVVQELAHVLNYLSVNERLPTLFKPVSPAPYMNGGPQEFLSWVIECHDPAFKPGTVAKWLDGRLPRPVDDVSMWTIDD
jgi:hypothetical protein